MNDSMAELPDELLLIILKKLDNIDVLHPCMRVNTRLDQIIRDPCFTSDIDSVRIFCQRFIIEFNQHRWNVDYWQVIIRIYVNWIFSFHVINPS